MRKPTFVLKPQAYKTNKLYAQVPHDGTGDLTPSSYAGNGTRVNKYGMIEAVASDVPRIDYLDGIGLLLEPTRQNRLTNSGTWAGFTAYNSLATTTNNSAAPDGEYTALRLEDSSGTASGYFSATPSFTAGTDVYSFSFFAKMGDREQFFVVLSPQPSAATDCYVLCDFNNGTTTVQDTGGNLLDSGMDNYGGGWKRFWFVVDPEDTDTSIAININPTRSAISSPVQSTGYMWVWGPQFEVGYFPTSYIPTSGSALTRSYDSVALSNIETLGLASTGSCAWLIDVDVTAAQPDTSGSLAVIGTTSGSIRLTTVGASGSYYPLAAVINPSTSATSALTNTRSRILFNVFGLKTDVWINGTKAIADTVDMYLTNDELSISGQASKIKLREMAIWDSPLNDTESKAITQS